MARAISDKASDKGAFFGVWYPTRSRFSTFARIGSYRDAHKAGNQVSNKGTLQRGFSAKVSFLRDKFRIAPKTVHRMKLWAMPIR
jgi:hypothetical protein